MRLFLLAVTALSCWFLAARSPQQIVSLADGSRYLFAGVTYSTNPVPPSLPVKILRALPKSWSNSIRKRFGDFDSQYNGLYSLNRPELFVWFKRLSDTAPTNSIPGPLNKVSLWSYLADESGVIAGGRCSLRIDGSVVWSYEAFPIIPRRSKTIQCLLFQALRASTYPPLGPSNLPPISVTFPNPLHGHYPDWQPEPLPNAKTSRSLEVRLDSVKFGGPDLRSMFRTNRDTSSQLTKLEIDRLITTQFEYAVRDYEGKSEAWTLANFEFCDASGNSMSSPGPVPPARGTSRPEPQVDWRTLTQKWNESLWPSESAWRLRLTFKRISGLDSNEIITFTNVPIPPKGTTITNQIKKTFDGREISLKEFSWIRTGPQSQGSQLVIETPGNPPDLVLDRQGARADTGESIPFTLSRTPGGCYLSFLSIPPAATSMDLTLVVQKSRTVEFTFKPPKPGAGE